MASNAVARQGQRKGDFLAGKYLLGDCLGIGGMGEVYRATNVSLGRDVAVKILSREFADNEDDVLRFLREARAAALVRHPNVVDVLDVARDDDGTPFIVQELLAGEDLERYLTSRGGRLPANEALEIMIPVADALGAAHEREVIHRDLKPANIFLSREGNRIVPKVLDFGASRYATLGDLSAKELRMLIGTPHYMAPEQIISKTDVDRRADVWALGVILYEVLVGESPFEAETANGVLQLVKTRDVPPLSKVMKGVASEIEVLVATCTARDRQKRYADAGEVLDAMRGARDALNSSVRTREETAPDIDYGVVAAAVAAGPAAGGPLPAQSRVPSLSLPEAPKPKPGPPPVPPKKPPITAPAGGPAKSKLLTLSSPESDRPPPEVDADDIDPFAESPPSASRPIDVARPADLGEVSLVAARSEGSSDTLPPPRERDIDRAFDEDDDPRGMDLELGGAPSPQRSRDMAMREQRRSSIPPVLDPRAATSSASPALSLDDRRIERTSSASLAPASSKPLPQRTPRTPGAAVHLASDAAALPFGSKILLAAAVLTPAVLAFVGLRVVQLTAPLGRALRGDSMLASGVLTVLVLVVAAVLVTKSMAGTRERTLFVAAAGAVLFGIVMIVVTFTAGEAPDLGEAPSGGVATWVAPIAPLAAAFAALVRAKHAWADKYDRRERVLYAALASVMVLVALEVGPLGAARSASLVPAHASGSAADSAPSSH